MNIKSVAKKQETAINALLDSPQNIFNLNRKNIKDVCYSNPPKIVSGSIKWLSNSHEKLWQELDQKSLEEIIIDFARQIQNSRVVKDVIGEENWYA